MKEEIIKYMLFAIFKRKVVESPLIQEIDRYLLTRSSFSTRGIHREWLVRFAKNIGVETAEELLDSDFDMYLKIVEDGDYRPTEKMTAKTALNLFRGYINRMNHPKRHVGRPAKLERNVEMFTLRMSNPSYWTYDRLAARYGIDKHNVWDIIKREEFQDLEKK